jgi:hypothetical protein
MTGQASKRNAHERARARDLSEYFEPGEHIEVFIETPPESNGGEEAVAKISRGEARDVSVFIDPGSHRLYRASRVRCRIRHVDDNHLKALATYRLD